MQHEHKTTLLEAVREFLEAEDEVEREAQRATQPGANA